MTIECYYTTCPYHDNEGPFCYETIAWLRRTRSLFTTLQEGWNLEDTTLTSLIVTTLTTNGLRTSENLLPCSKIQQVFAFHHSSGDA